MAYINLEKLKDDVLNSWNNDKHRGYAASQVHNREHQQLMLIVERQPTMDAVPRAKLEKVKTDTAREIFEEIEKAICEITAKNVIECTFEIDRTEYTELKKKYTEGDK